VLWHVSQPCMPHMADAALTIPQAAVILPCCDDRVLMQLRDDKEGIVFPGLWGFFSGAVEPGETPLQCAHRELHEELGFIVDNMHPLSIDTAEVPITIRLHSFCCYLPCAVEEVVLQDGYDWGLFTLQEINNGDLYSSKAWRTFPVISHPIIFDIARKCFANLQEKGVR
jgi:8-oxo-dGTP diphosphatase